MHRPAPSILNTQKLQNNFYALRAETSSIQINQINLGNLNMLHRFNTMVVNIAVPLFGILLLMLTSCGTPMPSRELSQTPPSAEDFTNASNSVAVVTDVKVPGGEPGNYTFAVTIESPDTGCEQYADWWEVVTPEGNLIYRRILAHSHVDEQPFQRSGGPVAVQPNQTVIVRAHMHPFGYGAQAMQGRVEGGFEAVTLSPDFAADLANAEPQPQGCAF